MQRPAPLPTVLKDEQRVPGYKHPLWLPRKLEPGEDIAVKQKLLEIEQRLTPAGREEILVMLTALAEYYNDKRTQDAMTTTLSMMVEDLADYSAPHLQTVMTEHRKTNNWFPKSAELINLLTPIRANAYMLRRRARILLGLEQSAPWELRCIDALAAQEAQQNPDPENLRRHIRKLPDHLQTQMERLVDAMPAIGETPKREKNDDE